MSKNPFVDEDENPFADSTIQNIVGQSSSTLSGDFPVFNEKRAQVQQPAVVNVSEGSPQSNLPSTPYDPKTRTVAGREELLRRQEELERKAEEIRRREEALNKNVTNTRAHNWPPLPQCCPIQPCFYHDINVEIPAQFQKTVRRGYRSWIFYAATLALNVIGSLAYFVTGGSVLQFGLSIFQLALFTPCSFIFWYRPLYKAFKDNSSFYFVVFFVFIACHVIILFFASLGLVGGFWYSENCFLTCRSDSSMNFMIFMFVQFAQVVCTGILAVGISGWSCGFITAIDSLNNKQTAVAIILFIVAGLFVINLLLQLYLLLQIHRFYRTSGATVAKAQEEFTQGVVTNSHVQQAAVGIASAAARSQMNEGGSRY